MIPIYSVDCIISIKNFHSKRLIQHRTISLTTILNPCWAKIIVKSNKGNECNSLFLSIESVVFIAESDLKLQRLFRQLVYVFTIQPEDLASSLKKKTKSNLKGNP